MLTFKYMLFSKTLQNFNLKEKMKANHLMEQ